MPRTLVLLAVLAGGCARPAPDPVRMMIEDVADASEERDADAVLDRLSESFRGQDGLGKADVAGALRRYFAAYESIDLELFDVQVQRTGPTAQVRTRVGFSGQANRAFGLGGLLPPSAVYRFDVLAKDEGGVWRVQSARWEQLEAPAATATP